MRKQCVPGVSPPPSQTPGYKTMITSALCYKSAVPWLPGLICTLLCSFVYSFRLRPQEYIKLHDLNCKHLNLQVFPVRWLPNVNHQNV